MRTVAMTTLGCKVNSYDTQVLLELFLARGYKSVDFSDVADVYVINTCAVTNLADKKSRQMAGRARKANPDGIVVAMGCATQASAGKYAECGVDIVVGTTNRASIVDLVEEFENKQIVAISDKILHDNTFEASQSDFAGERTRAFLKIQEGCSNFCTYCVIPLVRGRSRSRNFDDILAQAQAFAHAGYKEIVVAGIHVASYGNDLEGHNLIDALEKISEIDGIKRVRLSSVEPMVVTDQFCEFLQKNPKFCEHLHLSLQSGSDTILKAMNRKYDTQAFFEAVAKLKDVAPKINLTTDIIAGFPGETETDHKETMEFAKKIGFSKLHVFPYAAKDKTPAARMPGQIGKEIKTARVKELLELSDILEEKYYQNFLGQVMSVLVEEKDKNGFWAGKTANYIQMNFSVSDAELENEIVQVKLEKVVKNGISGTLLKKVL